MDGHLRGTCRGPVGVTGIRGTCHHMAPGQETSGPASCPPKTRPQTGPREEKTSLNYV